MTGERRTFLFMPESAYGPTNNCIGIGNELLKRGHRVVFAAERSWEGKLSALGFEEDLVDLAPRARGGRGAGRRAVLEGLHQGGLARVPQDHRRAARDGDPADLGGPRRRREVLRAAAEGHHRARAARRDRRGQRARVPRARDGRRAVRAHRLAATRSRCPATTSRPCSPGSRRTTARAGRASAPSTTAPTAPLWEAYDAWVQEQGAPPLPELEFIHEGDENLYVYPEVLDYTDERPLDEHWHRLDSSVRETEQAPADLPASFTDGSRPLVYFSLGSLGSADVELMQRVIAALADQPINVIVSKGPLHDEFELADNMWGAEFLPQTRILPLVDLVITHGGNNTTTEALHFGKPMVVLPLFWDQYDNAQRVHEQGFGIRLDPYRFTPEELQRRRAGAARRRRAPRAHRRRRRRHPLARRRGRRRRRDRTRRRSGARVSTGHAMTDAAVDALRDAAPTPYWLDRAEAPAPRRRVEGRVEADLVVIGAGFTGLWTAVARASSATPAARSSCSRPNASRTARPAATAGSSRARSPTDSPTARRSGPTRWARCRRRATATSPSSSPRSRRPASTATCVGRARPRSRSRSGSSRGSATRSSSASGTASSSSCSPATRCRPTCTRRPTSAASATARARSSSTPPAWPGAWPPSSSVAGCASSRHPPPPGSPATAPACG